MTHSCVYEGVIAHRRLDPVHHEFRYRIALMYLDLSELPEVFDGHRLWSARGPAVARFQRSDYLGDPAVPLDEAVRALVAQRTGTRPVGPIRLLTQLRYFGHCFNPVSFYYCFDPAGEHVRTVVAEVTNTPWGERHAYVLARDDSDHGRVMEDRFEKTFHVSPFMGMDHSYDWRLVEPGRELLVHIDSTRGGRKAFDATLTLERRELNARTLRRVLWRQPASTMTVAARIYLNAVKLRLKGAPYFPHPARGHS